MKSKQQDEHGRELLPRGKIEIVIQIDLVREAFQTFV